MIRFVFYLLLIYVALVMSGWFMFTVLEVGS